MRRWTGSVLVQVMACRRFGAEPLPDPMLIYCQLDPKEHTSVKFEAKYKTIHSRNTSENVVCEMAAIVSTGRWVMWQPRGSDMLPKFLENFQKSARCNGKEISVLRVRLKLVSNALDSSTDECNGVIQRTETLMLQNLIAIILFPSHIDHWIMCMIINSAICGCSFAPADQTYYHTES